MSTLTGKCKGWWAPKHNYGRWEITNRGAVTRGETEAKIGEFIYQQRICIDCHFVQISYDEIGVGVHVHKETKEV